MRQVLLTMDTRIAGGLREMLPGCASRKPLRECFRAMLLRTRSAFGVRKLACALALPNMQLWKQLITRAVYCLISIVLLTGAALSAVPDDPTETLFLRDGSVVKGVTVTDPDGTMLVYSHYGCLSLLPQDVLRRERSSEAAVSETWLIGTLGESAVVTSQRSVPASEAGATTFSLLVSGRVTCVQDPSGNAVPYQCRTAGSVERLIVRYADVPAPERKLNVTAQVDDALTSANGGLQFRQQYMLEQQGEVRVLVRYPVDWEVSNCSPEPAMKSSGLLIWQRKLQRQQRFVPQVSFRMQ